MKEILTLMEIYQAARATFIQDYNYQQEQCEKMKKLMKKIVPFLLALVLLVSNTTQAITSELNDNISLCGDEEDFIELGTLTRN